MIARSLKTLLRRFGVEIKRTQFGLDPWLDLAAIFAGTPPAVLFDVGANRGQTTLALKQLFPDAVAWAFEPNADIFPELQRALAPLKNTVAVHAALGAAEQSASLKITGASVNASLLEYARTQGTDKVRKEMPVTVLTLDAFTAREEIERIDLLKCDTQGYDLDVLKGADRLFRERRIRAVFVEVLFTRFYRAQSEFHDVYAFLRGHGLYLSGFHQVVREHGFAIDWCDALFLHPELVPGRPKS